MALSDLRDDVVYAGRSMLRNIGFYLVAVLIIGVGIGANTAVFSAMVDYLNRADRKADGQIVQALMTACAQAGISHVNLVAALD